MKNLTSYQIFENVKSTYDTGFDQINRIIEERNSEFNFQQVAQDLKKKMNKEYIRLIVEQFSKYNCDLKHVKSKDDTEIFLLNNFLKFYISSMHLLVIPNNADDLGIEKSTFETVEDFIKELKKHAPQYLSPKLGNVTSKTGL